MKTQNPASSPARTGRIRLRVLFALVGLWVLLPLVGGLLVFRSYEDELVRETERELIAQAVVLAGNYESALRRTIPDITEYGLPLHSPAARPMVEGYYTPVFPKLRLDTADFLPKRPSPQDTFTPADPYAAVAGANLAPLLEQVRKNMLSGLLILDYRGIIVAGASRGKSFATMPEVQSALRGEYHSVLRARDTEAEWPFASHFSRTAGLRLFAAFPVVHQERVWGVVYLSRTPQNGLQHLYAHRQFWIMAGMAWGILSLLTFALLYRGIALPLRRLPARAEALLEGNATTAPSQEHPLVEEFAVLAARMESMGEKLRERTRYIRDFATQLSRALDTPVEHIRAAATALDKHGVSEEEQHRQLTAITQDAKRIERLTRQLRELALADNLIPDGKICYIMPILMRLQSQYGEANMAVHIEGEGHCDAALPGNHFESILANLLDNAQQHGARQVRIDVELGETYLTLTVEDDGKGIAEADREKIFTPFFTTRSAEGGTGLGLGIVRALTGAYGGSITTRARTGEQQGAIFILTLPALQ